MSARRQVWLRRTPYKGVSVGSNPTGRILLISKGEVIQKKYKDKYQKYTECSDKICVWIKTY